MASGWRSGIGRTEAGRRTGKSHGQPGGIWETAGQGPDGARLTFRGEGRAAPARPGAMAQARAVVCQSNFQKSKTDWSVVSTVEFGAGGGHRLLHHGGFFNKRQQALQHETQILKRFEVIRLFILFEFSICTYTLRWETKGLNNCRFMVVKIDCGCSK